MPHVMKKIIAASIKEGVIKLLKLFVSRKGTYLKKYKSSIFIVRFAESVIDQLSMNPNPVMFSQFGELTGNQ